MAVQYNIPLVFDGSLISENAYFIQQREPEFAQASIPEIILEMMNYVDIFYMSGRKSAAARGGLIATNNKAHFNRILPWLPVYEGFATYGGMSTKEVEAMAVGLREMTAQSVASSSADFIEYFVNRLVEEGVPVVTPAGGLACHLDARRFLARYRPAEPVVGSRPAIGRRLRGQVRRAAGAGHDACRARRCPGPRRAA